MQHGDLRKSCFLLESMCGIILVLTLFGLEVSHGISCWPAAGRGHWQCLLEPSRSDPPQRTVACCMSASVRKYTNLMYSWN